MAKRRNVHIRDDKKELKDRYVTLPDNTYQVLRQFWCTHHRDGRTGAGYRALTACFRQ